MPTASDPDTARAFLRARIEPSTAALESALGDTRADAYASGSLALAQQPGVTAPLAAVAKVYGPDWSAAWDAWKPGNADAAALLDEGGFARLLDDAGVTVKDIADTTLDRMGTLLAQGAASGQSVDAIARSLYDLVDNPDRAYMIANTELARATSAASLDTYQANGVEQWNWLLSPDACPDCQDEQDANPHSLDDDPPPLHPNCRCSSSPLDFGATSDQSDQTEEDSGE